jgi:hypothetical protein
MPAASSVNAATAAGKRVVVSSSKENPEDAGNDPARCLSPIGPLPS